MKHICESTAADGFLVCVSCKSYLGVTKKGPRKPWEKVVSQRDLLHIRQTLKEERLHWRFHNQNWLRKEDTRFRVSNSLDQPVI